MTRLARHALPGLALIDHEFAVPLDHGKPGGRQITIFAREAVAIERENDRLPWLLFLQGGPGSGAPRPMGRGGWLARAVERYRVLLLDQRGTVRSARVDAASLVREGDAAAQADYLAQFRADSIVRDAEFIRRSLCGDEPWTVLGQSFGGFCALNYLSFHPHGLKGVLITGGIPPVGVPIDEVYRATYQRVLARNQRYYARYPDDADHLRRIVHLLREGNVQLPGGATLTPQTLQLLGLAFGFSDGFETVHYLLEEAFSDGDATLSFNFLHGVDHALTYEAHPLFSILQEALYCEQSASNWSAQRIRAEFPQFDADGPGPVYFTGEMIYPWMFDVFPQLAGAAAASELLARRADWPRLYDEDQLAANTVPTVAAVYDEDMYVERRFSEAVAARMPNVRTWITNEYDHNALRSDGDAVVFRRLLDMLDGRV